MESEKPKSPGIISPPPLIYFTLFLTGFIPQTAFPVQFFSLPVRWIVCLTLVGVGAILVTRAFQTMRHAKTSPNPYQPAAVLVTEGPFRFTRNPVYLGMNLFYLGAGVLLNPFWSILFFPVLLLIMEFGVIHREERHLEQRFGEAYLEYKASVRRWI
ncbi:MAG: isoprenylcysteine carboxylmethyltransferase family protein [Nitrospirae bacterium]|nr:isoprenylcysteine carboxylmethyltransferase family protein [Nitrospirota bacterium]